jgi:hypothetical protein
MSAGALRSAERRAESCERAAVAARAALAEASDRDGRLMTMLASNDPRRIKYEAAFATARQAERAAEEARQRVEQAREATAPKPDARLALKAAIAAAAKAERAIENNSKAIERAKELAGKAAGSFEQAQADVAKAKDMDAASMAKAARTGAPPAASMMRDARLAEQAAEDELMAARAGVQKLEQRQPDVEREHQAAQRNVAVAVDAVIRREMDVKRLLEEAERVTAELIERRLTLRALISAHLVTGEEEKTALRVLHAEMPGPLGSIEYVDWRAHPAALRFAELRKALSADADAPIEF